LIFIFIAITFAGSASMIPISLQPLAAIFGERHPVAGVVAELAGHFNELI
jgi:p-aminobenzoyl-glutamate transporter AbgT